MAPTKNRINMHDIIAQPLGALPAAVNAVLRRPEPLDDLEINSLFNEASFLFLRTEEALASNEEAAGAALIQLLLEGLTHSEDSLPVGLKAFAVQGGLLQSLQSVFSMVFRDGALPIQSPGAADLIQVICTLSDEEGLKDLCSEMFMLKMVVVLQQLYDNPSAANRHCQTQRSIAAALINMVKGSAVNKKRLSDWSFLLPCLTMSTDAFFQLQCVELLYRVSRKHRNYLTDLIYQEEKVSQNEKMAAVLQSLDRLINDSTLLDQMIDLVEKVNQNRSDVLCFSAKKVTAAETPVAETSKVYFTPNYFVVLITSTSVDNLTIPYADIRSVTISKDSRVLFRLENFPSNLDVILSHTAPGLDVVALTFNASQLGLLKASPVRSWVVTVLQERQEQKKPENSLSSVTETQPADLRCINEEKKRWRAVEEKYEGTSSVGSNVLSTSMGAAVAASQGVKELRGDTHDASFHSAEGKRLKTESIIDEPTLLRDTFKPSVEKKEPSKPTVIKRSSADTSLANFIRKATRRMPTAEKLSFLKTLEQLMEAKKGIRESEDIAELNREMEKIQHAVDDARKRCQNHRDEWYNEVTCTLNQVDKEIETVKEEASAAVEKLNQSLHQIKSSNQAMDERMDCMRLRLQQILETHKAAETEGRAEIQNFFETELERHECLLDDRYQKLQSAVFLPLSTHGQEVLNH